MNVRFYSNLRAKDGIAREFSDARQARGLSVICYRDVRLSVVPYSVAFVAFLPQFTPHDSPITHFNFRPMAPRSMLCPVSESRDPRSKSASETVSTNGLMIGG